MPVNKAKIKNPPAIACKNLHNSSHAALQPKTFTFAANFFKLVKLQSIMSLIAVGTMAFDAIETPFGKI
ncbi:MAG: hypothetical protein H7320_23250, partial [Ferruginibacter sp.]|nr:hypothetical protein [Ferruginibacter sp.]